MDLIITSAVIITALYFTVKLAVKNGIKEVYEDLKEDK